MGREDSKVYFVTTILTTSCLLVCQALRNDVDCDIIIYNYNEDEIVEMKNEINDSVQLMIISLEFSADMENLKSIHKKLRNDFPDLAMIFLIPDSNYEFEFIKDELIWIFEDEYQKYGDLVKLIQRIMV